MTLINVLNISEYLFLQENKNNYKAILNMLQNEKGVKSLKIEIQDVELQLGMIIFNQHL